jgi:hypothetical protein
MRSLGYPARNNLRGTMTLSKGIWLRAKFPFFVKMARAAKKWLAAFFFEAV